MNLYQKNPGDTHHWRANLARPSRDVDLAYRQKVVATKPVSAEESTPAISRPEEPPLEQAGLLASTKHKSMPEIAEQFESATVSDKEKPLQSETLVDNSDKMHFLKPPVHFLLLTGRENLGPNPSYPYYHTTGPVSSLTSVSTLRISGRTISAD